MNKEKSISLILRIGLAFTFIYVAISSFINPTSWLGFFPKFLQKEIILTIFSIYEIFIGLWLITNKKIFYASILSSITLFGIIIFNLGAMDIIFRDVAILFAAIALAILSKDN